MPRPIRNVQIYLPIEYNDGRPIEDSKFDDLEDELLKKFGGVTVMQRQFPLRGLWRHENRDYQDQIILFDVMDLHYLPPLEILRYLKRLKNRLDVLITMHELLAI